MVTLIFFLFSLTIDVTSNPTKIYLFVVIGNSEFQLIHELCLYVLSASQRTELIRATLATLHAFLSWIPLGYIFESPLVCYFPFWIILFIMETIIPQTFSTAYYSWRHSSSFFLCHHIVI